MTPTDAAATNSPHEGFLVGVIGIVFLVSVGLAEEANGLRVTAQKTLLEKGKDRDAFDQWDKVDKALGLKDAAHNTSFEDLPEGTLEYVVIVKRWDRTPEFYESYSGTETLPALAKGGDANLTVGKVPMSGYEIGCNRKQFQDSIEGWQVIVKHAPPRRSESQAPAPSTSCARKPSRAENSCHLQPPCSCHVERSETSLTISAAYPTRSE